MGDLSTRVVAEINGRRVEHKVGDLLDGPVSGYLDGFLSGAYRFDQAVPDACRTAVIDIEDHRETTGRDWYHVRVRQLNDQWTWSSPTWVGAS